MDFRRYHDADDRAPIQLCTKRHRKSGERYRRAEQGGRRSGAFSPRAWLYRPYAICGQYGHDIDRASRSRVGPHDKAQKYDFLERVNNGALTASGGIAIDIR